MQLFVRMLQYLKKNYFFAHKKLKKPPSKVAQKYSFFFLHYCPELPKWPKQKNSCSKMWLIDQLYIKLATPDDLRPNFCFGSSSDDSFFQKQQCL